MTHQAKRPYAGSQPSITSYFSASSSPSYSISSPSPYNGCSPPLPANVQSNLLSVGMRVRKSVPEGYKTGTYAFNLFSDPKPASPSNNNNTTPPSSIAQKPKTRPRAGNRELTPFCGILKVGGMAQQPWEIYNSPSNSTTDAMNDEEEEMPFLSSQGSTISNYSIDSPPSNGQKRRFFEDEDEVVENGTNGGGALGERILAVPRRKKWTGKVSDAVAIVGQENLSLGFSSTIGQDVDFQEADFLDYSLVTGDDLEMSG